MDDAVVESLQFLDSIDELSVLGLLLGVDHQVVQLLASRPPGPVPVALLLLLAGHEVAQDHLGVLLGALAEQQLVEAPEVAAPLLQDLPPPPVQTNHDEVLQLLPCHGPVLELLVPAEARVVEQDLLVALPVVVVQLEEQPQVWLDLHVEHCHLQSPLGYLPPRLLHVLVAEVVLAGLHLQVVAQSKYELPTPTLNLSYFSPLAVRLLKLPDGLIQAELFVLELDLLLVDLKSKVAFQTRKLHHQLTFHSALRASLVLAFPTLLLQLSQHFLSLHHQHSSPLQLTLHLLDPLQKHLIFLCPFLDEGLTSPLLVDGLCYSILVTVPDHPARPPLLLGLNQHNHGREVLDHFSFVAADGVVLHFDPPDLFA